MYEVGYSWVLTSVVFAAFLDQDLWPQFFLRGFKFGSTSHCSFIQSGFWLVFSSPLFEQLDWTSWDFEHVYAAVMEHPMLDQVSSVVSVLLHKYFYCSMVQEELVLQVGSLAWTPFWEQEKHSWAFWSIFWRIFTSWLHPGWRLSRCSGLENPPLDLASTLLDLLGRGKQHIPRAFIPHSKGLVPATKLSNSLPCVHVAKL
jgi:hypothetical protein